MSLNGAAGLLRRRSLLIFDFDGTLADTTPLHAEAFREVLLPLGVAVDYPSVAGMRTTDAMRALLVASGRTTEANQLAELTASKQQVVRRMIGEQLEPLPGVAEFLAWARPRFDMALATSGSRATVALALRRLGFTDWFSPVVCGEDVVHGKPAPDAFLRVLETTGKQPDEALVFEDSAAGLTAARAAGLDCVDVREIPWNALIGTFPDDRDQPTPAEGRAS